MLARSVIVVVVDERLDGLLVAQVMQIPVEVNHIDPHIQFHVLLGRGAQEPLAMVLGFGNGGVEVVCGIENTISAIREPAAVRVQMGESCHDDGGPGPTDAVFGRYELDIASLVTKPGICERVQLEDRFKVVRIGHPLE